MLLSLLTPSIKFALNKHFFIIIDTGKSPGMENSCGEKSGRGKVRRGKDRRGKFRLRIITNNHWSNMTEWGKISYISVNWVN